MPVAAFCNAHRQRTLFINKLTRVLVYAKGYLAKLVQYSEHFQPCFSDAKRDYQRQRPRVWRNLSFAKQHFDAAAQHLGHLCICMDAALSVLDYIYCGSVPVVHLSTLRRKKSLQLWMMRSVCR